MLVALLLLLVLLTITSGDVNLNSLGSPIGFRVIGSEINGKSGYSVSGAGDVNKDGVGDVIIGAFDAASAIGISYVIYGRNKNTGNVAYDDIQLPEGTLAASVGFRILGAASGDMSGLSVSAAGDINKDGIADIVVGSPGADPYSLAPDSKAGIAYVIFGRNIPGGATPFSDIQLTRSSTPMDATVGFRILGAAADDELGHFVNKAGDVNGDGVSDIIVSAKNALGSLGISYVIYGRNIPNGAPAFGDILLTTTSLASHVGFRILGASGSTGYSGISVSFAGDVNQDGIGDVIIGSISASSGVTNRGISYVVFGRNIAGGADGFGDVQLASTIMDASVGFRIIGPISSDRVGYSVSGACDVNGDGIADVLIGSDSPGVSGKAYVVFGRNIAAGAPAFGDVVLPSTTMDASVGFRILGGAVGDQVGYSVSAAGDVNRDGWADILIGGVGAGNAYVVYGRNYPGGAAPFGDVTLTTGPTLMPTEVGFRIIGSASAQVGIAVKAAGDINGDGVADMIIGAAYADPPAGTDVGITYIICGQAIVKPTSQPSEQPSGKPSRQPSRQPTNQPTAQPSTQPSGQPSGQPSSQPFAQPTRAPSGQPSAHPSCQPNSQPSRQPSSQPSHSPSAQPLGHPTTQPSCQPVTMPSGQPTSQPFVIPSGQPSNQPSASPTAQPSGYPSCQPSRQPTTQPSKQPNSEPSTQPSAQPSMQPTGQPSLIPTGKPTAQPTRRPSAQPSKEPSQQPNAQPTSQPTAQPVTHPTAQPTRQPTSQPSSKPSLRPTKQPTSQPSNQPTTMPSVQPSGVPTLQPSAQPTGLPSAQPSSQPSSVPTVPPTALPSGQPSSQPSSQPITRPSTQPSGSPTTSPTVQPSTQPSAQPSSQPLSTPSAQPSLQPSIQPLSEPTSQPSATPTATPTLLITPREYAYVLPAYNTVSWNSITYTDALDWGCGEEQGTTFCASVAAPGRLLQKYHFHWKDITSILQTNDPSVVVISGLQTNANIVWTEVARCFMGIRQLQCTVRSFSDTFYVAGSYASSVDKIVYVGSSSGYATVSELYSDIGTSSTYKYTSEAMDSISMSHVLSPPNFVGSFIAGTCTSIGSITYIFAGMVLTTSGLMTAMYVTPANGAIVNSVELVNAMALEYTQPDTFIAGGLQLTGEATMTAYVVPVNALYQSVLNGWRYHINSTVVSGRRKLTKSVASNSVVKGLVLVDAEKYVLISWNTSTDENSLNRISVLKTDLSTVAILQQVHIVSKTSSIYCSHMNVDGLFLTIACTVQYSINNTRALLLSVDRQLTFSQLPEGYTKYAHNVFVVESMAFQRTKLPLSADKITLTTTDYTFTTADGSPTLRPTVLNTHSPSARPSCAPSTQPSSSPSAAPSVSPQPTSHPSSSGPTNTYKPTVKHTLNPTRVPTVTPTRSPTVQPTVKPTARPTTQPSRHPSTQPSVAPTIKPTRAPQNKPTLKPSATPSVSLTNEPSLESPSTAPSISLSSTTANSTHDNIALVIGGSIAGGLLFLWCGRRLLQWSVRSLEKYKQKRGMQTILDVNQLQRVKAMSMQRHKARASGAYAATIPETAGIMTTTTVSEATAGIRADAIDKSVNNNNSGGVNNKVARTNSSDSSVILSSLHSSEMSYDDEVASSMDSEEQDSVLSVPRPLSHVRSEESIMEEGSVVNVNVAHSNAMNSTMHHSDKDF